MKKKKRPSLVQMMNIRQASPRTRAGAKWLSKVKKGQVAPKGLILPAFAFNVCVDVSVRLQHYVIQNPEYQISLCNNQYGCMLYKRISIFSGTNLFSCNR